MARRGTVAAGIAALSLLLAPGIAPAEMYKWTDKNGMLHITDYPPPGGAAKPMNLDSIRINRVGSGAAGRPSTDGARSGDGAPASPAPAAAPGGREYPRIEVYGTSWCRYCRDARNFFRSAGIPFEDYDLETDKDARARRGKLGGSGVPVIIIGDQVIHGFSQERIEKILGIR